MCVCFLILNTYVYIYIYIRNHTYINVQNMYIYIYIYIHVCVGSVHDYICAYPDQKDDCLYPPTTIRPLTNLLAFQHGISPIVWHSTCKHMQVGESFAFKEAHLARKVH